VYSVNNRSLFTERLLKTKRSKVAPSAWADYLSFEKAVLGDESQYIRLVTTRGPSTVAVATNRPEAENLIHQAFEAVQRRDTNAARDLLSQAERINPKQFGLWSAYSYIYFSEHDVDRSIDALRKEIQNHPDEKMAYQGLAKMQVQLEQKNEAIETLQTAVQKWSDDETIVSQFCSMLIAERRYDDALKPLKKALATKRDDEQLQTQLTEILLRMGQKEQGFAAAQKLAENSKFVAGLNNAAYFLADTQTNVSVSRDYAEKAVSQIEEQMTSVTLAQLTNDDLKRVDQLSGYWDTLGWANFRLGEFGSAERYLKASWNLSQHAAVADHLGVLYERQGKREAAAHAWQLALAANSGLQEARDHLRNLGLDNRIPIRASKSRSAAKVTISTGEELGRLRTVGIPSLPKQEGSAEFFLLFSAKRVEEVQFISGTDSLRGAVNALSTTKYDFEFRIRDPKSWRGAESSPVHNTPHQVVSWCSCFRRLQRDKGILVCSG
jgi:tetratricopeptide (TPR) repeat protein